MRFLLTGELKDVGYIREKGERYVFVEEKGGLEIGSRYLAFHTFLVFGFMFFLKSLGRIFFYWWFVVFCCFDFCLDWVLIIFGKYEIMIVYLSNAGIKRVFFTSN